MTRHHAHLAGIGPYLLTGHVGIAAGNVEELAFARSLPVGDSTLNHVTEIVELVTQILLFHPTTVASPVMRVGRVLRAGGIEVAVGLLRLGNDVDDRVAVGLQTLVRIGLQDIGGTFECLVGVGIVERVAHAVDLEHLRGVLQVGSGVLEVLVAAFALALREGEGYGSVTTGLEALTPERAGRHLDGGEGNGGDGVPVLRPYGAKRQMTNDK